MHIMGGGCLIGAIFMATDYTTSPVTEKGKVIFGLGCAVLTMLIRVFGSYPEGVSYAILLMNIVCPHINRMTRSKPFGGVQ
jgi:electron transport complex protein RnfD